MQDFWSIVSTLALVGALVATGHLLLRYQRPTGAIAWLFAIWVLPVVGFSLYAMLAVYQGPRRVRLRRRLSRNLRASKRPAAPPSRAASAIGLENRVAERVGALPMTSGNEVHLHPDARAAADDVRALLAGAEEEILLETYIWTEDELTEEVSRILAEKQAAGVHTRVLVDAIGSRTRAGDSLLRLGERGVPWAQYLAPNPLKGRFQINFRNHRKLLVIDGAAAVIGGRNVAAPYFDDGPEGIRDLSVRFRGPSVGALRELFIEDWLVATEESDRELDDVPIPDPCGDTDVRVIPHGCDEEVDAYVPILSTALRTAKKSVLIVTPYFVPGANMLHDLRLAALSGVQVRVLIPRRSPERWPEIAARRFFEPLLTAGVEIWVEPDPFLHAKAVVVDGRWVVVGSANFDQRSFYLNYELSCEVPDPRFARAVTDYFEPDFARAVRIDPEAFARRRWYRRIAENTAALFAPIL